MTLPTSVGENVLLKEVSLMYLPVCLLIAGIASFVPCEEKMKEGARAVALLVAGVIGIVDLFV